MFTFNNAHDAYHQSAATWTYEIQPVLPPENSWGRLFTVIAMLAFIVGEAALIVWMVKDSRKGK